MGIQSTAQDMTWWYRDLHNQNRLAKTKKQKVYMMHKAIKDSFYTSVVHWKTHPTPGELWHLFTLVSQILVAVVARMFLEKVLKLRTLRLFFCCKDDDISTAIAV